MKGNRATWGALMALTLVAFLLRASSLDEQSLWRDEVDVIGLASHPLPQLVQNLVKTAHNGPFYYLLMQGWLKLAGTSEFALRYLPLCWGVLAVPLTYQAGRPLLGRPAAAMGATLVAVSAYLTWYSQDAKMYSLVTALILLAVACQLKALRTARLRYWAGFVLSASLALYVHILSALMIPVYVSAFLLAHPAAGGRGRAGLVALALLILPYVPLAAWQLRLVLETYATGHPFYPLNQVFSLLFNLFARGIALVGGWVVVAAFVFAMLAGLFLPGEGTLAPGGPLLMPGTPCGRRARLFLVLWLLAPSVAAFLISLKTPVFEPRYLIFVAPAFYLLAGLGVLVLSWLSRTAAGLGLAAMVSFSLLGVWVQATTPIKSDFRAAARYVATHGYAPRQAPIMFQMPYGRDTFDYYFDGPFAALEGPWTNDGKSQAEVDAQLVQRLASYPRVWLVSSESWLWDSRGLTQAWFDRHARLIESARFALVDVYYYELLGEIGE